MIAEMPPTQASITGCNKLIFCLKDTMIIAAMVATKVAIMQGMKISVGLAAFSAERAAMIVTGISVSPDACRQRNMICALEAVSLLGSAPAGFPWL